MFGTAYYPITLTKNSSATVYFTLGIANNPYGAIEATGSFEYVGISKDGGTFAPTTNAPVEIQFDSADGGSGARSYGRYKLTLTASEMNADVITICWFDNGTGKVAGTLFIFTGTSSGGATAQQVWEYATRTTTGGGLGLTTELTDDGVLTGNGTVGDVLKALFYFLKKNKNKKTISR